MELVTITGLTSKQGVQCEKACGRIIVSKDGAFGNERITVKAEGFAGSETIIPNLKIADIAEIDQVGEGAQFDEGTGEADTRWRFINLANFGSLPLNSDGKKLVIDFDNLTALKTYGVQAEERLMKADHVLRRDKFTIAATESGQGKSDKVPTSNQICISMYPAHLTRIDWTDKDSQTGSWSLADIKRMQFSINDSVRVTPTSVEAMGYENLLTVGLSNIAGYTIVTDGSAMDVIVTYKAQL